MKTTKNYFSYGSNMDIDQMKSRCPDSHLQGLYILEKFKFIINSRGVATVIPSENCNVEGVLWTISEDDENNLDRFEGVPRFYTKSEVELVNISNKNKKLSLIYSATDIIPGIPRPNYLELILGACTYHQLSINHIQEISRWTIDPSL